MEKAWDVAFDKSLERQVADSLQSALKVAMGQKKSRRSKIRGS